jgi:hypothetical protein
MPSTPVTLFKVSWHDSFQNKNLHYQIVLKEWKSQPATSYGARTLAPTDFSPCLTDLHTAVGISGGFRRFFWGLPKNNTIPKILTHEKNSQKALDKGTECTLNT